MFREACLQGMREGCDRMAEVSTTSTYLQSHSVKDYSVFESGWQDRYLEVMTRASSPRPQPEALMRSSFWGRSLCRLTSPRRRATCLPNVEAARRDTRVTLVCP